MMTDFDVSQRLRPLLAIRGLSLTDRTVLEGLVREAERATEGFDPADAVRVDLYIERGKRLLAQAAEVIAKYADE